MFSIIIRPNRSYDFTLKMKNKTNKEIEEIKKVVVPILKKHNVKKAGIFGSYVRGEQTDESDVDVLIEPDKKMSLFDIAGIEIAIEKELRRKVDILTYNGINRFLKKKIIMEEIKIL